MSVEDKFYSIGTIRAVLKQLYSFNEFEICKQQLIKFENVKKYTEITLRFAAGKFSVYAPAQTYMCAASASKITVIRNANVLPSAMHATASVTKLQLVPANNNLSIFMFLVIL